MLSSIGSTIQKKHSGTSLLGKQVEAGLVVEKAQAVFDREFGADSAVGAKALFVKNRTLTVTCTHGSVAQDIRLRMQELVEKINTEHGSSAIDRIRYLS